MIPGIREPVKKRKKSYHRWKLFVQGRQLSSLVKMIWNCSCDFMFAYAPFALFYKLWKLKQWTVGRYKGPWLTFADILQDDWKDFYFSPLLLYQTLSFTNVKCFWFQFRKCMGLGTPVAQAAFPFCCSSCNFQQREEHAAGTVTASVVSSYPLCKHSSCKPES